MTSNSTLIYIVEDSIPSAKLYGAYLDTMGYQVKLFHTGMDALNAISQQPPDILVQDVQLPDISGMDILKEVNKAGLPTKTIIITSFTELDYAVEATRNGAFDYIEKPFPKDRLLVTVANAIKQSELINKVQTYSEEIDIKGYSDFIGSSTAMQLVYRIIDNVAPSQASVFITGESGTGKELCASAIHQSSKRSSGPFIPINCAAIPKDLFESEIFGHTKGAFSGATSDRKGAAEMANGGTLFLDELCEMDLNLQAKLLRLIQTGTFQKVGSSEIQQVDVRFVCATNREPELEVKEGRFREDLYYRLNVVPIKLPPLKDRELDVIEIAEKLLHHFSEAQNKHFSSFSPEVKAQFLQYDWPGNVRELQNVLENTVIMNQGDTVMADMLPEAFREALKKLPQLTGTVSDHIGESGVAGLESIAGSHSDSPIPAIKTRDSIQPLWLTEKIAIEEAIRLCKDNIPVAASCLGVSPSTLYRKMKNWEENN